MENQQVEQAPKPALPLLVLLALASALGVGVAIALAALAMLLAAPAYAGESGGGLVLERPAGLTWADRLFAEHEAQPQGVTRVVEVYQNRFGEPLAGVYVHRLPEGAVLERLTFNAELQPAVLLRRPGSALLERTAEIGPGETLLVELEYRTPSPRSLRVRCC